MKGPDMLSVLYTAEENAFRETVREFAEKVIAPRAEEIEATAEYPRDLLFELGKAGYMGALIPKEYGGTGLGMVYETIIAEEVSAVCAMMDVSRGVTSVYFAPPVYKFGNDGNQTEFADMGLAQFDDASVSDASSIAASTWDDEVELIEGHVYAIKTEDGYYIKFRVDELDVDATHNLAYVFFTHGMQLINGYTNFKAAAK